jgi:microcompartment protein CcmL/EutN
MGQAVGFIETVGLTAAMEAADAAVKSANVRMIGYELTNGAGMVTVKVEGDVGAVKSAIDAAKAASSKVSKVYSTNVIPRPANSTTMVIRTRDTVLREDETPPQPEAVAPIEAPRVEPGGEESPSPSPNEPAPFEDVGEPTTLEDENVSPSAVDIALPATESEDVEPETGLDESPAAGPDAAPENEADEEARKPPARVGDKRKRRRG